MSSVFILFSAKVIRKYVENYAELIKIPHNIKKVLRLSRL